MTASAPSSTAARSSSVSGMATQHSLQGGFGLQELRPGGGLGRIEVAPGARHAVRALLEEVVRAVPMPEVEVLPGRAVRRGAGLDGLTIDEHLDGPDVASKVTGIGVGLGQAGRPVRRRPSAARRARRHGWTRVRRRRPDATTDRGDRGVSLSTVLASRNVRRGDFYLYAAFSTPISINLFPAVSRALCTVASPTVSAARRSLLPAKNS